MSKIIVLGAGMVGSAMAIDLSELHDVTLTDLNEERLAHVNQKCNSLQILQIDVCNHLQLKNAIQNSDLVICAVPGFLGFETLKQIILAGKNVVDISFFPENAFDLNELAVQQNG